MRFSIVTPSWNSARFIGETVQSVVSQRGDFEIEYLVVDNASSDATAQIVERYAAALRGGSLPLACRKVTLEIVSERDAGMSAAINKGFARATGDICAWINADDVYLPGAFQSMARVFDAFPEVRWAKGITSYMDEQSAIVAPGRCFLYHQDWIRLGVYGREAYFIQQDSVFWRRGLWDAAGGLDERLRRAGDYALWMAFARHAPLYPVLAYVSCFRRVRGQLSEDIADYRREMDRVLPAQRPGIGGIERVLRPDGLPVPGGDAALYRSLFGEHEYRRIRLDHGELPVLESGSFFELQAAA